LRFHSAHIACRNHHWTGDCSAGCKLHLVSVPLLLLQAFSLLFTKYLHCLDVRFYTLAVVTRLARQHAVRGEAAAGAVAGAAAAGTAAAAAAGGGESDAEDDEAAQDGSSMRSEDVSRVMFDVLSHVTPIVPPKQSQDKDKQQQQQQQEELPEFQSWCGAAEVRGAGWLLACRLLCSRMWPVLLLVNMLSSPQHDYPIRAVTLPGSRLFSFEVLP
jgi:hypothetical protein